MGIVGFILGCYNESRYKKNIENHCSRAWVLKLGTWKVRRGVARMSAKYS